MRMRVRGARCSVRSAWWCNERPGLPFSLPSPILAPPAPPPHSHTLSLTHSPVPSPSPKKPQGKPQAAGDGEGSQGRRPRLGRRPRAARRPRPGRRRGTGGRVISGPKYVTGGWDPDGSDDEYVYVAPENPYDTNIVDTDEVTRVFSPSAVLPSSVCYMV